MRTRNCAVGMGCAAMLAAGAQAGLRLPGTVARPYPVAAVIESAGPTWSGEFTATMATTDTDVLAPARVASGDSAAIGASADHHAWQGDSALLPAGAVATDGPVYIAAATFGPAGTSAEVISGSDLDLQWSGEQWSGEGTAPAQVSAGGAAWGIANDGSNGGPFMAFGNDGSVIGGRSGGGLTGGGGAPELMPLPAPVALGLAGLVVVVALRRRMLGK